MEDVCLECPGASTDSNPIQPLNSKKCKSSQPSHELPDSLSGTCYTGLTVETGRGGESRQKDVDKYTTDVYMYGKLLNPMTI